METAIVNYNETACLHCFTVYTGVALPPLLFGSEQGCGLGVTVNL